MGASSSLNAPAVMRRILAGRVAERWLSIFVSKIGVDC